MKKPKSIFLVEDDKDDQLFFTDALSEISNTSLYAIANNGREALEILERNPARPDIIFMDINMPLMNGIECLLELNKKEIIQKIPVVILSTDPEIMDDFRLLGVRGFINKPISKSILSLEIAEMIKINLDV